MATDGPFFHLSTIVTAGAGTGNGPGATPGVRSPAVTPIAAPASAPRSSSQPAGGDARQRPPAGNLYPQSEQLGSMGGVPGTATAVRGGSPPPRFDVEPPDPGSSPGAVDHGHGSTPRRGATGTPEAARLAQQHARDAAAEVAYPNDGYGLKTGHSFGGYSARVVIGEGRGVDMSWQTKEARCLDSNRWTTDGAEDETYAKAQCLTCPLLAPCQAHALEHEHFHVWGGLTAAERTHVRNGRPVEDFLGMPSGRRRMGRPRKTVTVPMASSDHGTAAGYSQHLRRGQEPCEPCRLAQRAYKQQRAKGRAS